MLRLPSPDVLIIGTSIDLHIDRVVNHLPSHVSIARFNIDKYPKESSVTIDQTRQDPRLILEINDEPLDISTPKVAWFRRLGQIGLSDEIPEKYRQFCVGEAEMALEGVLSIVNPSHWINEYWKTRRAANKPYQYSVAQAVGLALPSTLITNSPLQARRWTSHFDQVALKSLHAPLITRDESEDGRTFSYTRLLQAQDYNYFGDVATTPCQFQPYIRKAYELRVTSFGDEHVAVRIDTDEAGKYDWRAGAASSQYSKYRLQADQRSRLSNALKRLGIAYAASDFIVTDSNETIFLESNPHGAWLWLDEEVPDLKITERFAKYLAKLAIDD